MYQCPRTCLNIYYLCNWCEYNRPFKSWLIVEDYKVSGFANRHFTASVKCYLAFFHCTLCLLVFYTFYFALCLSLVSRCVLHLGVSPQSTYPFNKFYSVFSPSRLQVKSRGAIKRYKKGSSNLRTFGKRLTMPPITIRRRSTKPTSRKKLKNYRYDSRSLHFLCLPSFGAIFL